MVTEMVVFEEHILDNKDLMVTIPFYRAARDQMPMPMLMLMLTPTLKQVQAVAAVSQEDMEITEDKVAITQQFHQVQSAEAIRF